MIKKYEIIQEEFLAHYLRRSAWLALEAGKTADARNAPLHFLSSIMSCAFALEAFLNYIGAKFIRGYQFMEKGTTPKEKLAFLSEQINIPHDPGTRPVQTIIELIGFRNFMAHGKSICGTAHQESEIAHEGEWRSFSAGVEIDSDKIIDKDERSRFKEWKRYRALMTADFAERCLCDCETIMSLFADAAGLLADAREQGADNPIWERVNYRKLTDLPE